MMVRGNQSRCPACNQMQLERGDDDSWLSCQSCSSVFRTSPRNIETDISHALTSDIRIGSLDEQTESDDLSAITDRLALSPGDSILDLRCNTGLRLHKIIGRSFKLFGVEQDATARRLAQDRLGLDANVVASLDLLVPHAFDLILMEGVLDQCSDPTQLFYRLFALGAILPTTRLVLSATLAAQGRSPSTAKRDLYSCYTEDGLTRMLKRLHFSIDSTAHLVVDSDRQTQIVVQASGSDFTAFMQERYVPGTWSKIAEYEHMPRYQFSLERCRDKHVLDFGSGTGYGTDILAEIAESVLGVDIDAEAINWSRLTHQRPNLNFDLRSDFGEGLPPASFDVITCFEMIEHVAEAEQLRAITSFKRLLKPNGTLLISTPNPEITAQYGANPYHLREMTRGQFEALLRSHFKTIEILDQTVLSAVTMTTPGALRWPALQPSFFETDARVLPLAFVALCSPEGAVHVTPSVVFDRGTDVIHEFLNNAKAANQFKFGQYQLTEQLAQERRKQRVQEAALEQTQHQVSQFQSALLQSRNELIETQRALLAGQEELKRSLYEHLATQNELKASQNELQASQKELRVTQDALAETQEVVRQSQSELLQSRNELLRLGQMLHRANLAIAEYHGTRLFLFARAIKQKPRSVKNLMWAGRLFIGAFVPQRFRVSAKKSVGPSQVEATPPEVSQPSKAAGIAAPVPYRVRSGGVRADGRPRVLHAIANFMVGGSSRLVVDLIEQLGEIYEQRVLAGFIPATPAYIDLDITELAGDQNVSRFHAALAEFRPDILHVHYWGDVDMPFYDKVFAAAAEAGCRVIQNINTPIQPYKFDAAQNVYVSHYVHATFGDSDQGARVIYPGSDFELFQQDHTIDQVGDCVGMVYRLEPDKLNDSAIEPFIEIVRRRPATKVLIVGGGHFLESFKRRVSEMGMSESFEFTGYVPYAELPDLYRRLKVFVAPVWKESFGQVTPFAMNMGIAVVGYDVGAIGEILDDPELTVQCGDAVALAEIAIQLLDDDERRIAIGRRNQARASELFSIHAMIDHYRTLYADAMLRHRP